MKPGLRRFLLLAAALMLGTLSCQMQELGLTGSARETQAAWESTKEVMATRVYSTARVVNTVVALKATATAQAQQVFLTQKESWPLIVQDSFENNLNQWPVGEESGEYVEINWNVLDGVYKWDALAVSDFVYWTRPIVPMVSDFRLSVDTRQISGAGDAAMGVIFRMQDADHYYALMIGADQYLNMMLSTSEGWQPIIDWTVVSAIRPGENNQIVVIGEGDQFTILINGTLAAVGTDDSLPYGWAGVLTSMYNEGDAGVFEFDNFTMRAPPGAVIENDVKEE